ncbi:hypothetical protein ACFW2I_08885 [Streptomyces nigra]|uniref:hypothetical protein n=1 Tax=Streptomyces nigra TaxID=1827580 RepID=UPI00367B01FF
MENPRNKPGPPLPKGGVVEIVDPEAIESEPLVPTRVLINGTDVGLIAEGGIKVEPGDGNGNVATVTLTLLPSRIEIKPCPPS